MYQNYKEFLASYTKSDLTKIRQYWNFSGISQLNKAELVDVLDQKIKENLREWLSYQSSKEVDFLKKLIKEELFPNEKRYKLIIPYEESYLLNEIYQKGNVEIINHREIGTEVVFIGRIKDIPREFIKYKVMAYLRI